MAEWNHRMCGECWIQKNQEEMVADDGTTYPFIRMPVMLKEHNLVPVWCCFCGGPTDLGIWVREDPKNLKCKHEDENDGHGKAVDD